MWAATGARASPTVGKSMAKQIRNPTDGENLSEPTVARDLVSLELSHRISNIFAVLSGLVALSARGQPVIRPFARVLQARIDALAAAHRYVSPDAAASHPSAGLETVKGLLRMLTAPYKGVRLETIAIEGEDAPIGLRSAGTLALIVHELATNAVKHGALSNRRGPSGCSARWPTGAIRSAGANWRSARFGRAAAAGVSARSSRDPRDSAQFEVQRTWRPEGLEVSISAPLAALGF